MGILTTSLPLPLDTVPCLDRLGTGSTDIGSGSKGLTVSFPEPPGTLREGLPDVLGARSPGATLYGFAEALAFNLDFRTSLSRRFFFNRVFSSRTSETSLSISTSFG
jgi:hypothetical protein